VSAPRLAPEELRSHRWFGVRDLRSFGHRSRARQMGFGPEDYAGRPVIGIINTWSDLNPCHQHFRDRVQEVKRGVLGSLAPDGCVVKTTAASPHLLRHTGPAVVFDDYDDLAARTERRRRASSPTSLRSRAGVSVVGTGV
jgi:dihydroxyacid dehydratase/phosphogluconate dehydratase